MDVGTASGNRVVEGAQWVTDHTAGGAIPAARARAAQQEATAATGQRLSERANQTSQGAPGVPMTPEQAAQGVIGELRGQISARHSAASAEYDRLRQFESDPAHANQVPVERPKATEPVTLSAEHESRVDSLLADARKHGYTGGRQALVDVYVDRLNEAREIASTVSDAGGGGATHADLLREISKAGGIGIELERGGGVAGELENLIESLNRSKGVTKEGQTLARGFSHQSGGLTGSSGIIVRKGGMTADNMLEHITEDPRWAGKFDNIADFMEAVRDAVGVENGHGRLWGHWRLQSAGHYAGLAWRQRGREVVGTANTADGSRGRFDRHKSRAQAIGGSFRHDEEGGRPASRGSGSGGSGA